MMTRFLRRWPLMLDVRLMDVGLPDFSLSLRRTPVRPGRRRARPYLLILEDRVSPAAHGLPVDHNIDEPGGQVHKAAPFEAVNRVAVDQPEVEVSSPRFSADDSESSPEPIVKSDDTSSDASRGAGNENDGATTDDNSTPVSDSTDGTAEGAKGKKAKQSETTGSGSPDIVTIDDTPVAGRSKATRHKKAPEDDSGNFGGGGGQGGGRGSSGLPDAAAANANGVPIVDRFVPPAATNPLPPTASPRATEATGRPQTVTSPPDTGGVTSPPTTVTGPPSTVTPPIAAPATAVPVTPVPVIGGLTPVRDVSVTPSVAGSVVLANFMPSSLDLPRSGGDVSPTGDPGLRFVAPNTGVPLDGSSAPGRPVPLPTAGLGAGVVTEELPELTLPPIELVPSGSDQSAPAAAVETGVSGTAVFVATVAAVGLLAGAYYSQIRRSGRGPRLRVQS